MSEAKTWKDFVKNAQTIADSGVEPVSVGGGDGWVLTDWFENIYLSQAGPEKYDQLAQHKIKWTDPSVKKALTTLGELFGKKELLAGGNKGALQTDFPTSVTKAFDSTDSPSAASVFEGDFVGINVANDTKAKIGKDAKVFPFPAVDGDAPVVTGGDAAVALKDGKAAQALLTFLASPDAAAVWAESGGFVSPNKNLDLKAYPNDVQRKIAKAMIDAGDDFRFDMSDQAPAAFGGTKGKGEWKALQDFLKNPKDVAGTQSALEACSRQGVQEGLTQAARPPVPDPPLSGGSGTGDAASDSLHPTWKPGQGTPQSCPPPPQPRLLTNHRGANRVPQPSPARSRTAPRPPPPLRRASPPRAAAR